jgi:tyrosine-protein kinase Etk/Wzc
MSAVDSNNIWERGQAVSDNAPSKQTKASRSALDIDLRRIVGLWPFILLFGLLGYAVGGIYLRYVTPVYTVSASLGLEARDEDNSLLVNLLGNNRNSLNDKIAYFKSPTLAAQLIDSLGIQYHAESQGRFKNKDFYGYIRWEIITEDGQEPPSISFSLTPKGKGFRFTSGTISGNANWGEPFFIRKSRVVVYKLRDISKSSSVFCYNRNRYTEAFQLSSTLVVNASSKQSNILTMKYSDVSSDRAIDILNGLISLQKEVLEREKSVGYSKTIDFIDKRLEPLGRDLDSIETALAQFKISRGIYGRSASGDSYLSTIGSIDNEMTQIAIKEATIKAVEDFINDPKQKESDLAYVGLESSSLPSLCGQFQELRRQREKLALVAQDANPNLRLLDKNIADLRSNMDKQLNSYKLNLKIVKDMYQRKSDEAKIKLDNAPIIEKELIEKSRFKNIKEALYLSMLQKREEALIARASVNVVNKVVYPPLKSNATIKPSKATILLTAISIGLIIPIIFGMIKEVTNKKVVSKKSIQNNTQIPVLAELEQVTDSDSFPFVIGGNSRSMFGEQIRSLRTNINFYLDDQKPTNYIIITSSMSGEGKSFLSMNLAKSYSLQGKKVALLEFDLRRPKISKVLGLDENPIGLSSFLIGKSTTKEIITPLVNDENEHFDLFPSGAIPPNPQELVSTKYMAQLKEYLDNNYDIVIVDTPPFGIVADAQIIGQWADLSLIVTRFNQTTVDQVYEIDEWNDRGVFKSMAIIFNGIKNSGYFGYKYGYYYYKRKYGYGYYSSYGYGGYGGKKSKKVY